MPVNKTNLINEHTNSTQTLLNASVFFLTNLGKSNPEFQRFLIVQIDKTGKTLNEITVAELSKIIYESEVNFNDKLIKKEELHGR